jgi:ribonuclease R
VQVILDRILAQERRLQFSIAEEGIPLTGTKPKRTPAKPKAKEKPARSPGSSPRNKSPRKKGRRR